MKKWLLATRPWSFTASVIPLTLGAALAWASDAAHAGLFLLTLLGGVAVQTGTNMLNIYGDYRSGVDTEASAHGESPILLGLISPEAMRRGGLIALCVAFHAVNGGSNPPGDAKNFNRLQQLSFWVTKIGLQFFLRRPSLEEFLF